MEPSLVLDLNHHDLAVPNLARCDSAPSVRQQIEDARAELEELNVELTLVNDTNRWFRAEVQRLRKGPCSKKQAAFVACSAALLLVLCVGGLWVLA